MLTYGILRAAHKRNPRDFPLLVWSLKNYKIEENSQI